MMSRKMTRIYNMLSITFVILSIITALIVMYLLVTG